MMRIPTRHKILSIAAVGFALICLVTSPQVMQVENAAAETVIQSVYSGFPLNLVPLSRGACGNDDVLTRATCMSACDRLAMKVRRNDDRSPAITRIAAITFHEPVQLSPSGEEAPQELPGSLAETGSKVLAEVIVYLRDIALEKSKPIPEEINRKLMPYFDRQILEKVRYTTDWNPTVGAALRQFIDTDHFALAVTLDNVIVFSDQESLKNLWLWAHELKHVEQYDRWGVKSFAFNYLQNYQSVENEANEYAAKVLREMRSSAKKPATLGPHF